MKHIEHCSECGAKKIVYKRSLRPSVVRFLKILSLYKTPMKLSDMKGVSPNQYPDIKRLCLWGFIEQTKKFHYSVTDNGLEFLKGNINAPYSVFTYRNEIILPPIGEIPEKVSIKDIVYSQINKEIILDLSTNKSEYNKTDQMSFKEF